jgi:hypothetical protein
MLEKLIIIALIIIIYGLLIANDDNKISSISTSIQTPVKNPLKNNNGLKGLNVNGVPPDKSIDTLFWSLFQSPSLNISSRSQTEVPPNVYLSA